MQTLESRDASKAYAGRMKTLAVILLSAALS